MQVTTAPQAAQRDAAAIAAGTEGFALMLEAGTRAAAVIMRVAGTRIAMGVDVVVGSGNNGGDGYIVAAQLSRIGVSVRVIVAKPPSTPDAQRAAALAKKWVPYVLAMQSLSETVTPAADRHAHAPFGAGVIVDALLGTGARGALRDNVQSAAANVHAAQQRGSLVVALDMPSGVHASTGECARGHVMAHVTIMFGTMRLGALSARAACGEIHVVDIGLGKHATLHDDAADLVTPTSLRSVVPSIAWNAHKGTRGRTLIVGGNVGMAGAVQLACSGALASGAGLVRASVAPESVAAVQGLNAAVVCNAWPHIDHASNRATDLAFDDALDEPLAGASGSLQHDIRNWAHVVVVGPGLGRDEQAAALLQYVLECVEQSSAVLVLDADALTVMAQRGMLAALRKVALAGEVVLTPHPGEFRTIAGALGIQASDASPGERLRTTRAMASALQCTVLSKGTPSICASAAGDAWFVPRGSNALATGGTGDVLSGVIAALIATSRAGVQVMNAQADDVGSDVIAKSEFADRKSTAALTAVAAWVHGVAGEMLHPRGSTVLDVVRAIPDAWKAFSDESPLPPGVLAQLPSVREPAKG